MDARTSLFMIAMFTLLIAWTWATSDAGLCAIGIANDAITKGATTTCFEFWFNRYQTLFASVVAFATALIALTPARGQLREMIAQSQQRRIDDLRERHAELATFESNIQRTLSRVKISQEALRNFYADLNRPFQPGFANLPIAACDEVTKEVEKLPISLGRPWGGKEAIDARGRYKDKIYEFGSFSIRVNNEIVQWASMGGTSPVRRRSIRNMTGPYLALADECFEIGTTLHVVIDTERRRIEAALDDLHRSIRV